MDEKTESKIKKDEVNVEKKNTPINPIKLKNEETETKKNVEKEAKIVDEKKKPELEIQSKLNKDQITTKPITPTTKQTTPISATKATPTSPTTKTVEKPIKIVPQLKPEDIKPCKGNNCNCKRNCGGNGICLENGKCLCSPGWSSETCEDKICPNNCSITKNNKQILGGICSIEKKLCECFPGFKGEDCSNLAECPNNCTSSTHGECLSIGKCNCKPEFTGSDCSEKRCPNNCNNQGNCKQPEAKCECYLGYYGQDCNLKCSNNCSSKGYCFGGQCMCIKGWTGVDCSKVEEFNFFLFI